MVSSSSWLVVSRAGEDISCEYTCVIGGFLGPVYMEWGTPV